MLKFRQVYNVRKLQQSISTSAWNSKDCSDDKSKGPSKCSKEINQKDMKRSSSKKSVGNYKRKYGHDLPTDSVKPNFPTLPDIPSGVFRDTTGEMLGKSAGKGACYKNPEYFSFHHMSFYDIHTYLRLFRNPSPKTGRKP